MPMFALAQATRLAWATDISGTYRVTLILVETENGQWQEMVWQSTKEQETKAR